MFFPERNGQQGVIVINKKTFIAHGCAVPHPPVIRAAFGAASFKSALVILLEHGKQDRISLGAPSEIVEGRERKISKAARCPAVLIFLKSIRIVRAHTPPKCPSGVRCT